jgi:hypothetical protein
MKMPGYLKRHADVAGILLVGLAALLAAWLIYWQMPIGEAEDDRPGDLNVPLGVEQAAIVTYSGPEITVAPYKWGVAVNVRIASVTEQAGTRVYDVRYIVNRGGTFDLKDYLAAQNGETLAGLPSFKFTGDPKLSKNLDTRIQETEEVAVEIQGHYYITLVVLAAIWLLWLLLLLFWRRPHEMGSEPLAPTGPSTVEILRSYLRQLEEGTLNAAEKAKMEMLLLRHWRQTLALEEQPMYASLRAIEHEEKRGEAMRKLQRWLHDPRAAVRPTELVQVLSPQLEGGATQ